MSKKMIYLLGDTDSPEIEIKFGDHWVPSDCSLESVNSVER